MNESPNVFLVKISSAAKSYLDKALLDLDLPRPGAMLMRQGPRVDVVRTPSGAVSWTVEHPDPWAIHIGSFLPYRDDELVTVDGIEFYLSFSPREGELGVSVELRDGKLFIEPINR